MTRFFNTAGPIIKADHYHVDPLDRINMDEILSYIRQKKYFVLHAPRQTGKTSYLLALMEYLNNEGTYKCLYTNIEMAQAARENVKKGIRTALNVMADDAVDYLEDTFLKDNLLRIIEESNEFSAFQKALKLWTKQSDKPVVLFIDEVDSLVGDTLISLLRQIRSGYTKRPAMFPQSIILCGVRDVRDYRIHSDVEKSIITGGSAFNIKSASLRMDNFSQDEIKLLYRQHTEDTGQRFHEDVFSLVWELTAGQPWLVNALGYEACFKSDEGRNREKEVTVEMIDQAKENLIMRRETHLDQLMDKLSEERVRKVIEPLLAGAREVKKLKTDDVDYVEDLGLIRKTPQMEISNRIYREIIPRELIHTTQIAIPYEPQWYIDDNGRLNMDKLLTAFQDFFRKNIESWEQGIDYKEAGPQLLLQGFLQRIVNGGGRIEREYGLGKQRTDLLVIWPHKGGIQEAVLELKLRYGSTEKTIEKGLAQTLKYMDKCGTKEGYLIIFDRRKKITWKEKIFKKTRRIEEEIEITVFGM